MLKPAAFQSTMMMTAGIASVRSDNHSNGWLMMWSFWR